MNKETRLAQTLGELLLKKQWKCAVAESCTGGMVAATITEIPGSSQWFERGFVTYSNRAKTDMLGVPSRLIATEGAVSESVVREMASAAARKSDANITVAISGVAGPGGGSIDKPVGLVWLAWTCQGKTEALFHQFKGDRNSIRKQAVSIALQGLIARCL